MPPEPVAGAILAGGLARRMGGGDKGLRELAGRPILALAVERLAPQVDALALNANGDPARFAAFALPVIEDGIAGFVGPLAGVLAGLDWAAARASATPWLATVAGAAPFFPRDLVARLRAAADAEGKPLACAASGGRTHPVFGLWRVALREDLRRALEAGARKVDLWTARHGVAVAEFAVGEVDPFLNVNAPEDLAAAAALLRRGVAA
jgi:molybdopterin-guanine dinucleotide biosynthesis protein A